MGTAEDIDPEEERSGQAAVVGTEAGAEEGTALALEEGIALAEGTVLELEEGRRDTVGRAVSSLGGAIRGWRFVEGSIISF